MAEGDDPALVERLVDDICEAVQSAREPFVRYRPNDWVVRMENFAPRSRTRRLDDVDGARPHHRRIGFRRRRGFQADIKTVTMLGGHAMTVTAITAQNTLGVTALHRSRRRSSSPDRRGRQRYWRRRGEDRHDRSAFAAEQVAARLEGLKASSPGSRSCSIPSWSRPAARRSADDATIAAFGKLMDVATIATPNLPELSRLTSEEDRWRPRSTWSASMAARC